MGNKHSKQKKRDKTAIAEASRAVPQNVPHQGSYGRGPPIQPTPQPNVAWNSALTASPVPSQPTVPRSSLQSIAYRPLDRDRGEIRLLCILPPKNPSQTASTLYASPEPIQCRLKYTSLASMESKTPPIDEGLVYELLVHNISQHPDRGSLASNAFFVDYLRTQIRNVLVERAAGTGIINEESDHSVDPARHLALQKHYEKVVSPVARDWQSGHCLLQPTPELFEAWLQTTIWMPLRGDAGRSQASERRFLALSYVWHASNAQFGQDGNMTTVEKIYRAGGASVEQMIKDVPAMRQRLAERPPKSNAMSTIIVDGRAIEVGSNLEKALRALREIPEVKNGMGVWIDALCINQNDKEEKGVEGARMGDIYKSATAIVSWLGDEGLSTTMLDVLNCYGSEGVDSNDFTKIWEGILANLHTERTLSLARFVNFTYWSRIWIVQEILLAGPDSIIVYGTRRFSTNNVLRAVTRLAMEASTYNLRNDTAIGKSYDPAGVGFPLGEFIQNLERLKSLYATREGILAKRDDKPVLDRLWFDLASTREATDPRDLVYSLCAILPGALFSLIEVDYSEACTFSNVMLKFALAHMGYTNSLRWLLYRPWKPFAGFETWPSWLPNLALPITDTQYQWGLENDDDVNGDKAKIYVTVDVNLSALCSRGMQFDTVYQNAPSSSSRIHNMMMANLHLLAQLPATEQQVAGSRFLQSMMDELPDGPSPIVHAPGSSRAHHMYGNEQGLREALLACFEKLQVYHSNHANDGQASIFDLPLGGKFTGDDIQLDSPDPILSIPSIEQFKLMVDATDDLDLWGVKLRDFFSRAGRTQVSSPSAPQLTLRGSLNQVSWFTTTNGYIGISLWKMQPGDALFILPGCSMPVILRRTEILWSNDGLVDVPVWEMMGSAFVPGVMKGELPWDPDGLIDVAIR